MSPEQITAYTGLVVAISTLIGVAVASFLKLKGMADTQKTIVAASAARDVKLEEVHAAVGASTATRTDTTPPTLPEVKP